MQKKLGHGAAPCKLLVQEVPRELNFRSEPRVSLKSLQLPVLPVTLCLHGDIVTIYRVTEGQSRAGGTLWDLQ